MNLLPTACVRVWFFQAAMASFTYFISQIYHQIKIMFIEFKFDHCSWIQISITKKISKSWSFFWELGKSINLRQILCRCFYSYFIRFFPDLILGSFYIVFPFLLISIIVFIFHFYNFYLKNINYFYSKC